ncbi:GNAT family N-acetyltransferase [Streptomyces sp. NBC_00708]
MVPAASHAVPDVRPAGRSDLGVLLGVLSDAREDQERQGLPPSWRVLPHSAVAAGVDRGETYLVQLAGEPVGTFALESEDAAVWPGSDGPKAAYLHRLAVVPFHHGRGIGAFAVDWAARTAAARGCLLLRLDAVAANARLCSWYERLGFSPRGEVLLPGWQRASMRFEREV